MDSALVDILFFTKDEILLREEGVDLHIEGTHLLLQHFIIFYINPFYHSCI